MGWVFLWLVLAFGTHIWLCFRVGRSNVALAIATFFIGFPAAFYTFLKQRGNPETSVTIPFVANVVFTALFFVTAWQTVMPLLEAQAAQLEGVASPAAPKHTSSPASAASAAEQPASSAAPAASAASSAQATPALDPMDNFSAALRAGGLNHNVTRLTDTQQLPPGVTDAALFSVTPLASASTSASAASSSAAEDLSVTLFKCESANACRNLAGLHMQQAGPSKRRVLQNGLLLLSMPPVGAGDADLTPTAVASVFRKL
jgi:hypothetical protein